MQWFALSVAVTMLAFCCDTSPVASDLSRALGAVLEEDTTTGEEKQKLLFF
jgi:hypothetical protein